jgi:uncharacterized protein (DUF1330 family)
MRLRLPALGAVIFGLIVLIGVSHEVAKGAETLPGLLVVDITVKDPGQFEAYGAKAGPILTGHKATLLFRATNPTAFAGTQSHKALIGFRFPSKAAIKDFYNSPDYQALIPLRTAAADVVFTAYEIAQEAPSEDMRALLAVKLTVKDAAQFGEYGKASQPIVQAHGGKLLVRAINPETLFGEQRHKVLVLFKFPDRRAVANFYNSEAYQKLIPLRSAAADAIFSGYDL